MTNGEIYHLWENFRDLYRYTFGPVPVQPSRTKPVPIQVRVVPVQVVFCFFCFDQRSYFGHNLLISYLI